MKSRNSHSSSVENSQMSEKAVEKTKKEIDMLLKKVDSQKDKYIKENKTAKIIIPPRTPSLMNTLISIYSNKSNIMKSFKIQYHIYKEMKNTLENIDLNHRGKIGFIGNLEDRIIALLLFMKTGSTSIIKTATHGAIKHQGSIQNILNDSARKFRDKLVEQYVYFENVNLGNTNITSVVDCTVVPICRPHTTFMDSKIYYSGKHKQYAMKKEVIVNVVSGTASYVSPSFPGSINDITVLQNTSKDIIKLLNGTDIIGDKGYRSMNKYVPTGKVASDVIERKHRPIIERFFGRLKNLFVLFCNRFKLHESLFDVYFDIAVALTNIDIHSRPLNEEDAKVFHNIEQNIMIQTELKRLKKKETNDAYISRKKEMEREMEQEIEEDSVHDYSTESDDWYYRDMNWGENLNENDVLDNEIEDLENEMEEEDDEEHSFSSM